MKPLEKRAKNACRYQPLPHIFNVADSNANHGGVFENL